METVKWDNSLSIQVDEIDEDHKRLIELFNMLNQAVAEKYSQDYITALLDELVSCTIWHFKHEERLMLKYRYSDLPQHKAEHEELTESARAMMHKFYSDNRTLSGDDLQFLERWLIGHILGSDMEMGTYLSEAI